MCIFWNYLIRKCLGNTRKKLFSCFSHYLGKPYEASCLSVGWSIDLSYLPKRARQLHFQHTNRSPCKNLPDVFWPPGNWYKRTSNFGYYVLTAKDFSFFTWRTYKLFWYFPNSFFLILPAASPASSRYLALPPPLPLLPRPRIPPQAPDVLVQKKRWKT